VWFYGWIELAHLCREAIVEALTHNFAQGKGRFISNRIVHVQSIFPSPDETGQPQDASMLRHLRLQRTSRSYKLTGRQFPIPQGVENFEAHRFGKGLKHSATNASAAPDNSFLRRGMIFPWY
jgi:hypothetical protein